jgi:exosortase family protein XrtG
MTLAVLLVAAILWLAVVVFFRRHRIWLIYYVIGAVGLAFLLIAAGRSVIPAELLLKTWTAYNVHTIAGWVGVQTRIFTAAPGTILVLVIPQKQGWTMVEIGIECSGLLEEAVLIGLLGFYPGWRLMTRLGWLVVGSLATYAGNLIRVLFIVVTLHQLGKDSLFLAHTVIGRIIFFFFIVLIYWVVLTRPTLQRVRDNLLARQAV